MAIVQSRFLKLCLFFMISIISTISTIAKSTNPADCGIAQRTVEVRIQLMGNVSILGPLFMVVYIENTNSYEAYLPRGIDFLENSAPFVVRLTPFDGGSIVTVGKGTKERSFHRGIDGVHGAVGPGVEVLAPGESKRLIIDISRLDGAQNLVAGQYLVEFSVFSEGGKIVGVSNQVKIDIRGPSEHTTNCLPFWVKGREVGFDHVGFDYAAFLKAEDAEFESGSPLEPYAAQFAFHRAWRALLNADGNASLEYDPRVQDAIARSIASMETSIIVYEDAIRRSDQASANRIRQVVESSMPEIAWRLNRADQGIGLLRLGEVARDSGNP